MFEIDPLLLKCSREAVARSRVLREQTRSLCAALDEVLANSRDIVNSIKEATDSAACSTGAVMKLTHAQKWPELETSLLELLDAAIEVDHAVKGTVQLLDRDLGALEIAVHRGFDRSFLQLFEHVRPDEPSGCGRALRLRCRVMIPDVAADVVYAPYRSMAFASGYRAVQSTPIIAINGSLLGILSTHFAGVHQLSDAAQVALDDYASKLAGLVQPFLLDPEIDHA
jgi:hypothetical protein